jgi:hypothetical protein
MAEIQPLVTQSTPDHVHIAAEICPWCEQPIPHEKFTEISNHIAERERERFSEVTRQLREDFAREKAATQDATRAELERVRIEGNAALQKQRVESAASIASAHEEGRKTAEAAAQARLAEAERIRTESEIALQARIADAEQGKNAAEQARADLKGRLEQLSNESSQAIEVLKQESAVKEAAARQEERLQAEASIQERLVETERLNAEAIATMQAKIDETEQANQTIGQEMQELKQSTETVVNERVQEVREALEKDKVEAVNVEKAKAFEETLKLTETVHALQRQLEKKTADELGEGAEIDLYEALKGEFADDRIDRVEKGIPGADIIHVVVHNGRDCGTIIYDSKNRNSWRNEYVTKLAEDQIAAKAEHAILSSHKFPGGQRQLCVQDGIIIANPARVIALVQVLRKHVVQGHTLRFSNEARTQKTAALYEFITSERCGQLFERVDTHTDDLLDLQVKEKKAHDANWKRQGELIRSVQRARAEISGEIDQILGTASELDEAL